MRIIELCGPLCRPIGLDDRCQSAYLAYFLNRRPTEKLLSRFRTVKRAATLSRSCTRNVEPGAIRDGVSRDVPAANIRQLFRAVG